MQSGLAHNQQLITSFGRNWQCIFLRNTQFLFNDHQRFIWGKVHGPLAATHVINTANPIRISQTFRAFNQIPVSLNKFPNTYKLSIKDTFKISSLNGRFPWFSYRNSVNVCRFSHWNYMTHHLNFLSLLNTQGARGGEVGWGTALQVGRSRVRSPMVYLEFFIDIILLAALWPWGRHRF